MKKNYELYELNSQVYGISRHLNDGKISDHCAIYDAIVESISIDYDKDINSMVVNYWLKTPDGQSWGDSCPQGDVSDNFDELINKMRGVWRLNSNTFGD
jgi:hypothetical protein